MINYIYCILYRQKTFWISMIYFIFSGKCSLPLNVPNYFISNKHNFFTKNLFFIYKKTRLFQFQERIYYRHPVHANHYIGWSFDQLQGPISMETISVLSNGTDLVRLTGTPLTEDSIYTAVYQPLLYSVEVDIDLGNILNIMRNINSRIIEQKRDKHYVVSMIRNILDSISLDWCPFHNVVIHSINFAFILLGVRKINF